MRQWSLVVAFVVATWSALAAQSGVAGTWELVVDGPQGRQTATLTLAQEGTALSGTIAGDTGTTNVAGEVAGSAIQFSFDYMTPNGPYPITMTAIVDGNAMTGSANYGQGSAPFTATRKP
jgi:hypothetical protein